MIAIAILHTVIVAGAATAWARQKARADRLNTYVSRLLEELDEVRHDLATELRTRQVIDNLRHMPVTRNCPEAEL